MDRKYITSSSILLWYFGVIRDRNDCLYVLCVASKCPHGDEITRLIGWCIQPRHLGKWEYDGPFNFDLGFENPIDETDLDEMISVMKEIPIRCENPRITLPVLMERSQYIPGMALERVSQPFEGG